MWRFRIKMIDVLKPRHLRNTVQTEDLKKDKQAVLSACCNHLANKRAWEQTAHRLQPKLLFHSELCCS